MPVQTLIKDRGRNWNCLQERSIHFHHGSPHIGPRVLLVDAVMTESALLRADVSIRRLFCFFGSRVRLPRFFLRTGLRDGCTQNNHDYDLCCTAKRSLKVSLCAMARFHASMM